MIDLIILILAGYKLSHLIAIEDGPFEMLDKFREWTGVKVSEYGEQYGTNQLSTGIICMNCNSVWVGIAIATAYTLVPEITSVILLPFAISGAVTLVNNY